MTIEGYAPMLAIVQAEARIHLVRKKMGLLIQMQNRRKKFKKLSTNVHREH